MLDLTPREAATLLAALTMYRVNTVTGAPVPQEYREIAGCAPGGPLTTPEMLKVCMKLTPEVYR